MGIGKIGGGAKGGSQVPTSVEVKAARLLEQCAVEAYATNRITRRLGKRAPLEMPLYLARNRVWLGRARRRELACPKNGFRKTFATEEIAHIAFLADAHGGLLDAAWCGIRVDQYPGPHMSRWSGIRAEATCDDCRKLALGFTMGRADV